MEIKGGWNTILETWLELKGWQTGRTSGKPKFFRQLKTCIDCYIIDFIVHVSSHIRQSTLHCSCFISFPWVHTSLMMFHFYFLQSTIHLIHFTYHSPSRSCLPYLVVFIIKWSFNLTVSFTFQPIPSLEVNDLRVSLDKFLILDRYSLLEVDLRWFYYSLSHYIKQEIQQYVTLCAINPPPWVFLTFFKLCKCYQIAQRTTYFPRTLIANSILKSLVHSHSITNPLIITTKT